MHQLKACMPGILKIWEEDCKRGRYKARWKTWEDTVAEMDYDEQVSMELRNRTSYDAASGEMSASKVSDLIEMK